MELLLVICQYTCNSSDFRRERREGGKGGFELSVIYSDYIRIIKQTHS